MAKQENGTTRRNFLRGGARMAAGGLWASLGGELLAVQGAARPRIVRVWSEGTAPKDIYPNDINAAVAEGLARMHGWEVRTAAISDPEQGMSDAALAETDVLVWWGHTKHGAIPDVLVEKIVARVRDTGMGFIALHSSHYAKPFQALVNGSGTWKGGVVNDGKPNRITVAAPNHPIARGVRDFTIPREERYQMPFEVPAPETIVLDGVYEGNNTTCWQGITWTVGKGRVFYFRPGHETYPVYFQPEVRRVLRNAVFWAGKDETGLWDDNDPAGRAARATREPSLAVILMRLGYAGTDVTEGGEAAVQRFAKAGPGPVTFRPLAAYGVEQVCAAGWYRPAGEGKPPPRTELWRIDRKHNKQDNPPLMPGGKTTFEPGADPFGLWVATAGFPGEVIYTEDALQSFIPRFKPTNRHKAHVYAAVRSDGTPVPNAYLIGFEYSTNDDNQEIVALVENVKAV